MHNIVRSFTDAPHDVAVCRLGRVDPLIAARDVAVLPVGEVTRSIVLMRWSGTPEHLMGESLRIQRLQSTPGGLDVEPVLHGFQSSVAELLVRGTLLPDGRDALDDRFGEPLESRAVGIEIADLAVAVEPLPLADSRVVLEGQEIAVEPVLDHLGKRAGVRGDDRRAAGESLDGYEPEGLVEGWEHEEVGGVHELEDFLVRHPG